MKRRTLRLYMALMTIEQTTESLLMIPTLHETTSTYLIQKKSLIQRAKTHLMELNHQELSHSKESALLILSYELPAAHKSLIEQFIDYRFIVQNRMSAVDCSEESRETCQQFLAEIDCLIDFLLVEAEKQILMNQGDLSNKNNLESYT